MVLVPKFGAVHPVYICTLALPVTHHPASLYRYVSLMLGARSMIDRVPVYATSQGFITLATCCMISTIDRGELWYLVTKQRR
jgi:hypothetical protein